MDGIVLLSKQPGLTSFTSLNSVKKALNTKKVGHTGTLDSFAQGLMVVCVGRMTRLAGRITEFDKAYESVIKFGVETDTLEYTGTSIRTAPLPDYEELKQVVAKYTGNLKQQPPAFSAIHVDGQRASDLARKGGEVEIPAREIIVYKAELKDVLLNEDNKVLACKIDFVVSKGTYIRSLARDIAKDCCSAGHLIGLYRTKVGNFSINEAAGYSLLKDFTIENCLKNVDDYWSKKNQTEETETITGKKANKKQANVFLKDDDFKASDDLIKKEIVEKIKAFTPEVSIMCGFVNVHLKEDRFLADFQNGKPVLKLWFQEIIDSIDMEMQIAVFSNSDEFVGLIEKKDFKHFKYIFVVN